MTSCVQWFSLFLSILYRYQKAGNLIDPAHYFVQVLNQFIGKILWKVIPGAKLTYHTVLLGRWSNFFEGTLDQCDGGDLIGNSPCGRSTTACECTIPGHNILLYMLSSQLCYLKPPTVTTKAHHSVDDSIFRPRPFHTSNRGFLSIRINRIKLTPILPLLTKGAICQKAMWRLYLFFCLGNKNC